MAANMCIQQNCTDSFEFLYEMITEDMWTPWETTIQYLEQTPWLFSLIGSTMIGLTGIFPLLVIPNIEEGANLKTGASAGTLKVLLSFAVGGLLGDVFLHLLPEAWENSSMNKVTENGHPSMTCGIWVLTGFLVFVIAEKLFGFEVEDEPEDASAKGTEVHEETSVEDEKEMENNNCITLIGGNPKNGFSNTKTDFKKSYEKAMNEIQPFLEKKNGYSHLSNGYKDIHKNGFVTNGIKPDLMCTEFSNTLEGLKLSDSQDCLKKLAKTNGFSVKSSKSNVSADTKTTTDKPKHITGYLNLIANIIDNFTHGLAVGGSFLVSFRLGVLTTFAILIHEIPHEVGDFAILLRSGFNRWDAARAQLLTATGGIFGAMTAVCFSGGEVGAKTSWILPFTSGGFLHIGLVTILPELLKEPSPKESLKQLAALLFGIVVMALLTLFCD